MFGQYDEAITLGQDFLEACNQANRSDSIPAFIMVKISQAQYCQGRYKQCPSSNRKG